MKNHLTAELRRDADRLAPELPRELARIKTEGDRDPNAGALDGLISAWRSVSLQGLLEGTWRGESGTVFHVSQSRHFYGPSA